MSPDLDTLLTLRTGVLALGQQGAGDWWPCAFLTPNGARFMASPFPRSAFWASLHASTTAAARHHDERIGAGGSVHLFRLNHEIELRLRDRVLREGWRPETALDTPEAHLGTLESLAEAPEQGPGEGPVRVADTQRFAAPKTLAQVAGLYAAAFGAQRQALPYGSDRK